MQRFNGLTTATAALKQSNAARAFTVSPEREEAVKTICAAVKQRGDAALVDYARQFDCAHFEAAQLRVSEAEIEAAWQSLAPQAQRALQRAADNIEAFHRAQPVADWSTTSPDG